MSYYSPGQQLNVQSLKDTLDIQNSAAAAQNTLGEFAPITQPTSQTSKPLAPFLFITGIVVVYFYLKGKIRL